jgi:tryptophanyl-tRNA synthetase
VNKTCPPENKGGRYNDRPSHWRLARLGESHRVTDSSHKKRVLSGMRPTGRLHIGHFFGALENWVKLQNDPQYESFYFIADWHALTSDYADTSQVAQNTIEIATDWLASGLDPAKSTMFIQSSVPEHAELHLLLSMVTPLSWLERVPTYKEALENVRNKDLHTYGFLGYPILQTADIVMYGALHAKLVVPVGDDQASHVEISREIVRKFNAIYGLSLEDKFQAAVDLLASDGRKYEVELNIIKALVGDLFAKDKKIDASEKQDVIREVRRYATELGVKNFLEKYGLREDYASFVEILTEPQVLLTKTPRIPGLDGRKMSKSYGNAITLSESDADIRAKTKVMVTDPARKRRTDPGNPDVCPVYDWHKLFSPPETLKWSAEGCRTAAIGCIECKAAMAENLIKWIAPVRARREEYAAHPEKVLQILDEGSVKARAVALKTMARVREAVFHWDEKRAEIAGTREGATSSERASS